MSVARYPLAWPAGWPRATVRKSAAFKVNFDTAVRHLADEIERMGGRYPVLSSNLELRLDGSPKLNQSVRDPGVAVYFELKGQQKVFACDTFHVVKDNIRAIGLTIEALRSIQRYGASALLDRALSAFDALPPPKSCWDILGLKPGASENDIETRWRELALAHHPDRGGSNAKMAEINQAKADALKAVTA